MKLIDELTYRSYRYNRQRTPDITPEQWAAIFDNVADMEARYQAEFNTPDTTIVMTL